MYIQRCKLDTSHVRCDHPSFLNFFSSIHCFTINTSQSIDLLFTHGSRYRARLRDEFANLPLVFQPSNIIIIIIISWKYASKHT